MITEPNALDAARSGDARAFEALIGPWRTGLRGFCYRMLGGLADADDAVQETLLRAWRSIGSFEGRSQLRTWLYQIATRVCLDLIEKRKPRTWPSAVHEAAGPSDVPKPDVAYEYVDPAPAVFEEDVALGPDAVIERRESVALALLVALQSLPAMQRAVLVLRDVMGLQATEVAELLETTVAAVNSALQRARANVEQHRAKGLEARLPVDAQQETLLSKYLRSWETSDASALLSLLRADAMMTMPPMGEWYAGAEMISTFLRMGVFERGGVDPQRFRGVMTRLSGGPAIAMYSRTGADQPYVPNSVHVLEMHGGQVKHLQVWVSPELFGRLNLPLLPLPRGEVGPNGSG